MGRRVVLRQPYDAEHVPDLGSAATPAMGGHEWYELGTIVSVRLAGGASNAVLEVELELADGIELSFPPEGT